MSARLVLATVHLLALAVGTGGLWSRARALHDSRQERESVGAVRRALTGDAWWIIALLLWMVSGVWRVFGATEKGAGYYIGNHDFLGKMGLFAAIIALEAWPMNVLLRWRFGRAQPSAREARRIEMISYVQCILLLAILPLCVSIAHGYGGVTAPVQAVVNDSLTALGSDVVGAKTGPGAEPHAAVAPTGSEVASAEDVALLTREIAMPVAGIDPATLHSNFDELRGGTRRHEALDIMAARGTPVISAAAGRVLKLFTSRAGGLMIYATDSSERFIFMYAHLNSYAPGVHDGSVVQRGQVIGAVGSTGNAVASAPHLHFALARSADVRQWWKGTPIDPLPVLQAARR